MNSSTTPCCDNVTTTPTNSFPKSSRKAKDRALEKLTTTPSSSIRKTKKSPREREDPATVFPITLHKMICDSSRTTPHLVRWTEDGHSVFVNQNHKDIEKVLLEHFPTIRFSTVLRNLHTYNFVRNNGYYTNPDFHRDTVNPSLWKEMIQRSRGSPKKKVNKKKKKKKSVLVKLKSDASTPIALKVLYAEKNVPVSPVVLDQAKDTLIDHAQDSMTRHSVSPSSATLPRILSGNAKLLLVERNQNLGYVPELTHSESSSFSDENAPPQVTLPLPNLTLSSTTMTNATGTTALKEVPTIDYLSTATSSNQQPVSQSPHQVFLPGPTTLCNETGTTANTTIEPTIDNISTSTPVKVQSATITLSTPQADHGSISSASDLSQQTDMQPISLSPLLIFPPGPTTEGNGMGPTSNVTIATTIDTISMPSPSKVQPATIILSTTSGVQVDRVMIASTSDLSQQTGMPVPVVSSSQGNSPDYAYSSTPAESRATAQLSSNQCTLIFPFSPAVNDGNKMKRVRANEPKTPLDGKPLKFLKKLAHHETKSPTEEMSLHAMIESWEPLVSFETPSSPLCDTCAPPVEMKRQESAQSNFSEQSRVSSTFSTWTPLPYEYDTENETNECVPSLSGPLLSPTTKDSLVAALSTPEIEEELDDKELLNEITAAYAV